jgi:hypothetical protein
MDGMMFTFTRFLFLVAIMNFALPAHGAEGERPPVAAYAKVYRGSEGMVMSLLGIGKPEDEEYLLQYAGINHNWDLKIFKVKKVPSGTGHNYRMTVNGRDYDTVVERSGWGGMRYQVYIPKGADGLDVIYDDSYSKQIQPQHYLTDYLQQESGTAVKGPVWR